MRSLAHPLIVITLVSGALIAAADARTPARTLATGWSGTLRVVDDINHTFPPGNEGLVVHVDYHDEATYTLTGETTPDGLHVARMTGTGVGRYTGTRPFGCVAPQDPYYQWAYDGPATVSVSYANGRWVVSPQKVTATYTSVVRWSACGQPDQTLTYSLPAPLSLQDPPRGLEPQGQAGSQTATSISGSESVAFAPPFALPTLEIGTAVLTWSLSRPAQKPPPGHVSVGPAPGRPPGKVKRPGATSFEPVAVGQSIPRGTIVDVSQGAGVTIADAKGRSSVFYGEKDAVPSLFVYAGVVAGFVELRLSGGNFKACKARALQETALRKPVRRLWGKGKGSFRTKGRYASAAVRGTWWLTADYCDRTLVSVKQGVMTVRDLVRKKTVIVPAGKSYSASAP
jgi:hypothetical protein